MTGGIELDLTLPLDRFELRLSVRLAARACAVIGPSGAGKSSLLEAIAGLRPRARGRIAVDGEVLLDTARGVRLPPERRRVGWVPQDGALFPHLDVLANLRFAARGDGARLLDDTIDLLELRPLLARYPATLSGGERQRVALGRALAASPRLLLADEPLAALDAPLRERVLPLFTKLAGRDQLRMLYVTHHLGEAQALDGEALLLRHGALEAHGPVAEVLTAARLSALDPAARFDNLVAGRITARDEQDGTARLELDSGAALAVPASGLTVGARAQFALPAEDLLVAIHPLDGISARNVLAATVVAVDPLAAPGETIVCLDAAGLSLRACLTGGAVTALALAPGRAVFVAAKAHSFRRLA